MCKLNQSLGNIRQIQTDESLKISVLNSSKSLKTEEMFQTEGTLKKDITTKHMCDPGGTASYSYIMAFC